MSLYGMLIFSCALVTLLLLHSRVSSFQLSRNPSRRAFVRPSTIEDGIHASTNRQKPIFSRYQPGCSAPLKLFVGESSVGRSSRILSNSNRSKIEVRTNELKIHSERLKTLRLANATSDELMPSFSLFLEFMQENPYEESDASVVEKYHHHSSLLEAAVQAIRAFGKVGSYRMVASVMEVCISYANNHAILSPRIFGEGIAALSKTRANLSKIKSAWGLVFDDDGKLPVYLMGPVTAFEFNVMLNVLAKRGATRACINLVDRYIIGQVENKTVLDTGKEIVSRNEEPETSGHVKIIPDAYTASSIFSLLASSVASNQTAVSPSPSRSLKEMSLFQASLHRSGHTSYWQWNKAIQFISYLPAELKWNNHMYSSLLELHSRIVGVEEHPHPDRIRIAFIILHTMVKNKCWPSTISCTIAMKTIRLASSSVSWQLALKLIKSMIESENLPDPGVFTYTEAVAACARSRKYTMATRLLEDMRNGTNSIGGAQEFVPPQPNTWVYNAVLSAVATHESNPKGGTARSLQNSTRTVVQAKERCDLALHMLDQMKSDYSKSGFDTRPDAATYGTIFAIFGASLFRGSPVESSVVLGLLDEMADEGINADETIYCNAISALSDSGAVLDVLKHAIQDKAAFENPKTGKVRSLTKVFNAALSAITMSGDELGLRDVVKTMVNSGVEVDDIVFTALIKACIRCIGTLDVRIFLMALDSSNAESASARRNLSALHLIDLNPVKVPTFHADDYSTVIGACLANNDLEQARFVLSDMHAKGLSPKIDCLESFAHAYARLATKMALASCNNDLTQLSSSDEVVRSRAQSAFTIYESLEDASYNVKCAVTNACAKAGLWKEMYQVLGSLHDNIVISYRDRTKGRQNSVRLLLGLHRTLLVQCAKQGDVRNAMGIVDHAQKLRARMRSLERAAAQPSTKPILSSHQTPNPFSAILRDIDAVDNQLPTIFLGAKDWVLLLTAAQRSSHWRVCLSTLHFLRPFVERCHPSKATSREHEIRLRSDYDQIAPALGKAVRCLESRLQHGWALRMIEDWIDWSGRQPCVEAVLTSSRVLASRGCGEEAATLVSRCVSMRKHKHGKGASLYDEQLCVGVITSLHRAGLYDSADEVLLTAVSRGCDYIHLTTQKDSRSVLDLHGLNVALAHSAVRIALQNHKEISKTKSESGDGSTSSGLVIVTGLGRNSAIPMRPILRPEVQRMLLEEFFPPLNTASIPGNMGALFVSDTDIAAWQSHQNNQKNARMLALASALKNVSGGRLRESITRAARRPE